MAPALVLAVLLSVGAGRASAAGMASAAVGSDRATVIHDDPSVRLPGRAVSLEGEEAVRNAARADVAPRSIPWRKRGLPLPLLTTLVVVLIAIGLRRRELWHREAPAATGPPGHQPNRPVGTVRIAPTLFWAAVLAGACALAGWGIGIIKANGYSLQAWPFGLGCVVGGIALRRLNGASGTASTWSSFVPSNWSAPPARHDRLRTAALLALALVGLGICVWVLRYAREEQALAVAGWIAAQIGILAAAFPPLRAPASERAPVRTRVLLGVILLGAVATRFWQIGYYPDFVHHDHVLYGEEILRALRGDWAPFFGRGYSVGRPWFLPVLLAFQVFGIEYWVLRLTGAVCGVVLVGATYLLGTALFNRRTGLIAAALVTVNHLLLLYSRQPYVLDPVAPFVLAAYCAAVGLQRGSRFHWCLAGILMGWSLLGYYASVTYVPIVAGFLLYLACFHWRSFWRARTGFLWFVAGLAAVYLPVVAQAAESAVVHRARDIVVFLTPDGSIRWDGALWASQLERSFGYIFRYYNDYPWGISSVQPICIGYESCLFGIGLTYMVLRFWAPAPFALLLWIVACIFLGSATLPTPPTPYHFLAAVVAIMLVSAVALDRALAPTDRFNRAAGRIPPLLAASTLLAAIGVSQVGAVWHGVRRLPPRDGRAVLRADAMVMAARFVHDHPEYRHYLVRSRADPSSTAATFKFFSSDSDLYDLTRSLDEALPIPPGKPALGASFIFMPSRAAERGMLTSVYPEALEEEILFGRSATTESLWTYLVDAAAVRRAYEQRLDGGRLQE